MVWEDRSGAQRAPPFGELSLWRPAGMLPVSLQGVFSLQLSPEVGASRAPAAGRGADSAKTQPSLLLLKT